MPHLGRGRGQRLGLIIGCPVFIIESPLKSKHFKTKLRHLHARIVMPNRITSSQTPRVPHGLLTGKQRARLSATDVISIFLEKKSDAPATKVGLAFGISEKTVRDIWKGRTWAKETWHLEPTRQLVLKQVGRPKGSKDSMPRRKRIMHQILLSSDKEGCTHAHASPESSGMDFYLIDLIHENARRLSSSFAQYRSGIRFCGFAEKGPESIDDQLHLWNSSI